MDIMGWIFTGLIIFTLITIARALNKKPTAQDDKPPPSERPVYGSRHHEQPAPTTTRPTPTQSADQGQRTKPPVPGHIARSDTPGLDKKLAIWGEDLTVIWQGQCADIEFTYNGTRRKVTPEYILRHPDGREYINGYCHARHENRTFNTDQLDTKILSKSRRYEAHEWMEHIIGPEYWEH